MSEPPQDVPAADDTQPAPAEPAALTAADPRHALPGGSEPPPALSAGTEPPPALSAGTEPPPALPGGGEPPPALPRGADTPPLLPAAPGTQPPQPDVTDTADPTDTADTPAPGPRPPSPAVLAARPGPPRPSSTVAATTSPAAPSALPDRSPPGRVTEDGTVLVRLPTGGEQVVGQWAAGEPAEGLAFFARKYDDLMVEVDLATRRLREGKAAADQAAAVVRKARDALANPAMVGDLAVLETHVGTLEALISQRAQAAAEERAQNQARVLEARERIAAEAESLADSTQWKSSGERFKALLEQWKSTPRADRGAEQELWRRFSHARSVFDKRRRQHFAKLDSERGEVRQVKEAIIQEAEALSSSTDWGATAGAYRELMARWKAAGRAGKGDEERLWERFRTAQDAFFRARSAVFDSRDAGQKENLTAKLALLAEAEAIDTSDLTAAKATLRTIQERWEAIGHVPRADKERIEARLRKVEDAVRRGDQERWRRTNPEARARAEDTVAQFQASLARLEAERTAAEAAGEQAQAADLAGRIASTRALLEAAERAAAEFGA